MTALRALPLWRMLVMLWVALTAVPASAADVRIRLLRQQGGQVRIYHDQLVGAADGTVEVLVGATPCRPTSGDVMRPVRGGDALTTLIVLDRGGTPTAGMAQYAEPMRQAVGGFLESVVGKVPGDKVTIIASSGRDQTPRRLPPTDKFADVKSFLDGLPEPKTFGADVYGVAAMGLTEMDRAGTPLGAVIIISDGVDPGAASGEGASDNRQMFIREAKRRGVPVATLHVSRYAGQGKDQETKLRNGRAGMLEVANETNGDFRSVDADGELSRRLRAELDDLGRLFAQVNRTTCTLCGKIEAKQGAVVDLKVRKGGKLLAQSLTSPPPRMDLPGDDYVCPPEGSSPTVCSSDAQCSAGLKCQGGKCVPPPSWKDKLPWIAGGLLALGLLLGLWAWRRSEQRKQQALAEAAAERERQLREQAEQADRARRQAEDERARALEESQRRRTSNDADLPPGAPPGTMAPGSDDVLRLAAAPGSQEAFDRGLAPGVYVLGAGPSADLRFQSGTVSGDHAQLEVEPSGRAYLLDLGSSNGTYVNQVRLQPRRPVELRVGDLIGLSRSVLLQVHGRQVTPGGNNGQRGGRSKTMLEE